MGFVDLLIHTCTTKRFAEGAAGDYGAPTKTWSDNLVNQACRLEAPAGAIGGREVNVGAEVVVADHRLFIENVDITEQDLVVIGGITYEVLLVEDFCDSTSVHHKRCWLRVVR